jgi:hypothetical protein
MPLKTGYDGCDRRDSGRIVGHPETDHKRTMGTQRGKERRPPSTTARRESNKRIGGPAGTAIHPQKACEKRASRNSPSFAVALNCGMGSNSLNAEVNAFDRLQSRARPEFLILRLEVQVMHGAGKVLGSFEFAFDECLIDDHLRRDIGEFASLPRFDLLTHGLEVSLHPVDADGNAIN